MIGGTASALYNSRNTIKEIKRGTTNLPLLQINAIYEALSSRKCFLQSVCDSKSFTGSFDFRSHLKNFKKVRPCRSQDPCLELESLKAMPLRGIEWGNHLLILVFSNAADLKLFNLCLEMYLEMFVPYIYVIDAGRSLLLITYKQYRKRFLPDRANVRMETTQSE